MDPIFVDTIITDALGTVARVAAFLGLPWWVPAGIGALIALLTLIRFGKAIKVEKAPVVVVSDGGSKDDLDLPPARQDPKAKNDLNDGGDAG